MQITPNIHQINLGYVNVYLIIEEDGLTLIDAGMSFHYNKIISGIQVLGQDPTQIKTILLTHGDPDHAGSIAKLRKIADFKIYTSKIEADALREGKGSRQLNTGPILGFFMRLVELLSGGPKPIIVDEVIKDGDTLPILDGMQVVATPGHTPGHLSFFFPAHKFLVAGDSMRTDQTTLQAGNIKMITWNAEKLFASIEKQSQLGAEIVAVGHGPVMFDVSAEKFPTA